MDGVELSILIPHYNRPVLLEKLLDSILYEIDDRVEVIVVDDISTKELERYTQTVENYCKRGIQFFLNDSGKKGPGVSRNMAIEHACGKWIIFADSDDYFLPKWYSAVKTKFGSDADLIFFMPTSINTVTGQKGKRHQRYEELIKAWMERKKGSEVRLRYDYNSPCSKMIRREIIENHHIRFDAIMHGEDTMASIKIGEHSRKLEVADEKIYCITEGGESMTGETTSEVFLTRAGVFMEKYQYVKNRVSKEEWEYLDWDGNPLKRLKVMMQRRYGIAAIWKYLKMLSQNKVPLVNGPALRAIAKKILVRLKRKKAEPFS